MAVQSVFPERTLCIFPTNFRYLNNTISIKYNCSWRNCVRSHTEETVLHFDFSDRKNRNGQNNPITIPCSHHQIFGSPTKYDELNSTLQWATANLSCGCGRDSEFNLSWAESSPMWSGTLAASAELIRSRPNNRQNMANRFHLTAVVGGGGKGLLYWVMSQPLTALLRRQQVGNCGLAQTYASRWLNASITSLSQLCLNKYVDCFSFISGESAMQIRK